MGGGGGWALEMEEIVKECATGIQCMQFDSENSHVHFSILFLIVQFNV